MSGLERILPYVVPAPTHPAIVAYGPRMTGLSNPQVWINKSADGTVLAGIEDYRLRLTPAGWVRVEGSPGPPVSQDDAGEAIAALCSRLHGAELLHCDVDDRDPWPDAPGPWCIEVPFRVLWPEE